MRGSVPAEKPSSCGFAGRVAGGATARAKWRDPAPALRATPPVSSLRVGEEGDMASFSHVEKAIVDGCPRNRKKSFNRERDRKASDNDVMKALQRSFANGFVLR